MKKGSLGFYIFIGLVIGFLIGVFGRGMPARYIAPAGIALGAVALFMYADRTSANSKKMNEDSTSESRREEDVKVLSPDAAREWLDDFLVKQQEK